MAEGRLYFTAADHLNHYPYPVRVPYYVVGQQSVFQDNDLEPVYRPESATILVETTASIHQQLVWYETKTRCEIISSVDVLEIFHRIDAYLKSVESRVLSYDMAYTEYVKRLLVFRKAYYRQIFLKVLNNNPAYKRAYLGEVTGIETIMSSNPFFRELFGKVLDPVEAMENPPIEIPTVIKPTPSNDSGTNTPGSPMYNNNSSYDGVEYSGIT